MFRYFDVDIDIDIRANKKIFPYTFSPRFNVPTPLS